MLQGQQSDECGDGCRTVFPQCLFQPGEIHRRFHLCQQLRERHTGEIYAGGKEDA